MNSTVFLESIEVFHLYYTPILVYLGSVGNCLCIYVFRCPKLRKLSTSCYLSALAISDTVYLVALFIVWLTLVGFDIFNKAGPCQVIVYVTAVCSFLSVWFVVAFTVERFVAVRYPLLRTSLCTIRRARGVLLCLSVIALALYSPMLIFAEARHDEQHGDVCDVKPHWRNAAGIFNALDTIITFIIPVLVIVVLNICISRTVRKLDKVRRRLTQRREKLLDLTRHESSKKKRIKQCGNTQKKITKMLLIVSTIFLCFNLPSYVMRVLTYLIKFQMFSDIDIVMFKSIQHICVQFFNTNFGINFILYCVGGVNFRKAVISTLYCHKKSPKEGVTPRGTTSIPITLSQSRTLSYRSNRTPKKLLHSSIATNAREIIVITNVTTTFPPN